MIENGFHMTVKMPVDQKPAELEDLLGSYSSPEDITVTCSECGGSQVSETLVLKKTAPFAFIYIDRTIAIEKKTTRAGKTVTDIVGLRKNLGSLKTPTHGKVDLILEGGSELYKLIAIMKHRGRE